MCGLTGFWQSVAAAEQLHDRVATMTRALAHRGPDDEGHWFDDNCGIGLGHRRLSIFDVSPLGHQPMRSRSGRWTLVFNGEIYNFLELRTELERLGHAFRSRSDTEVLLAAIEQWGVEEALTRSVGMFAIAAFDSVNEKLWLGRDRLGKKPLYWGSIGGGLAFASELHSFRAAFRAELATDRDSWALYTRFGFLPEPFTIYRDIRKLSPGCLLVLGRADLQAPLEVVERAFWKLDDVAERGLLSRANQRSEVAQLDELHELLRDVVRLHAQSDVPIGAFLSGGIDSSLVVALMQEQCTSTVRTFSVGFSEKQFDESLAASEIAARLGTEHTTFMARPEDLLALVERLPEVYDEPFADSSQLPTLLVCRLAREHVTVALTGDGGDELFAGYNRHVWADRLNFPLLRSCARGLTLVPSERWTALADALNPLLPSRLRVRQAGEKIHKLSRLAGTRSPEERHVALATQWFPEEGVVPGGAQRRTRAELGLPLSTVARSVVHPIERALWFDTVQGLPADMLVKVDRASMSVGLEARQPLLDHRLVELSWRMPMNLKLRDGVGKWALREILARYLPRKAFERPKQGFAVPLAEWLRGPLREWADDLLSPRALGESGIFEASLVRREWAAHLARSKNVEHRLWVVLMAQAWSRCSSRP